MKNLAVTFAAGFLVLVFYTFSYLGLQGARHEMKADIQASPLFNLPEHVTRVLALEFKGLMADYAVMEAGSIVGKKEKLTDAEWKAVERVLGHAISLDPYFQQTYMLLQGTVPWHTDDHEMTIDLLEKSRDHRFWDWIPGFFIGFDYFYFLKDNLKASEALMAASSVKDAPPALATFGARLAQEVGKNDTAIAFLRMMLEKEKDQEKRDMLQERLDAHLAVAVLENGLAVFHAKYGKNPERLDILVSSGVLPRLPENPYGKPFIYDNATGVIKF